MRCTTSTNSTASMTINYSLEIHAQQYQIVHKQYGPATVRNSFSMALLPLTHVAVQNRPYAVVQTMISLPWFSCPTATSVISILALSWDQCLFHTLKFVPHPFQLQSFPHSSFLQLSPISFSCVCLNSPTSLFINCENDFVSSLSQATLCLHSPSDSSLSMGETNYTL